LHLSRDGKENVTTLKRFSPCAMVRLPLPLPPAFFLFSFKGYQVRLQCMASLPVLCKSLSWTEISSDFSTGIPLVMSVVLFFPKGNCINVLRMVFFEETTRMTMHRIAARFSGGYYIVNRNTSYYLYFKLLY
jgi:hypothetical protein